MSQLHAPFRRLLAHVVQAVVVVATAAVAGAIVVPGVARAQGAPPAAAAPVLDPPLLRFTWTPAEITEACAAAEATANAALLTLVGIPDASRTFDNTVVALDRTVATYQEVAGRVMFMKDIHPDAAVRDVAAACEERSGKFMVALSARQDLYKAMQGWQTNEGTRIRLDNEGSRLVELTMRDFKRNGLLLSDADRQKLIKLRSRITELQTRYSKTLNDDKTSMTFSKEDLLGLPDDFIAAHEDKKKPGRYTLTTKYPDYYPVMEGAKKAATRQKMEKAFMNRGGAKNPKLLDEAVSLRDQAAKLLGYATHADYVAEDRMAQNAATVAAFLARMQEGLKPALEKDREKMLALKVVDEPGAKVINAWDWRYYMNQIKRTEHNINDDEVRTWFPADKVMSGMFRVYETVLGITLTPVKDTAVWADGVTLYEVKDAATKKLLARFYVDLFPRDGKYGHAAEFTLSPGQSSADGKGYRVPMCALVMNVQPPVEGKASFLSMSEVETLFHEFGHVMHESLTVARHPSQAGTRTALDFVEAPSQMLENWAYEPQVLALISQDPTDPKKSMPAALAEKLKKARKYNAGVNSSRQVFLATFDQRIHTSAKVDSDAVAKKIWAEVLAFPEDKAGHFAGTFGHMMGGYDGGYYGYLWSEVFAADMWTRFQKEGVMNPVVGRAYRDKVIARGRTVEPDALLRDFLGRAANETAFLEVLGIKAAPAPAPAPPASPVK